VKLILDTHVWIRWLSADQPLDGHILETIADATGLAVSPVSCWEVAYLVKRNRLVLPMSLPDWMQAALDGSRVEVLDLTLGIAMIAAGLPDIHRDPADRFIMATALATRRNLVSLDQRFRTYEVLRELLIY
jgi:PIN domain nuclease of toxin-antitoxin system